MASFILEGVDARYDLLGYFMDVTGVDVDRAKFHLESAAWDLQVALSSFYEDGGDSPEIINQPPQPENQSGDSPPRMVPSSTASPVSNEQQQPPGRAAGSYTKFGAVHGLATEHSSDDDEEEGQAFYAGGSERSGQQILGPGKNKTLDIVAEMFKSAKDHGAEVVEESPEPKKKVATTFRGHGYVLGATETDSQVVAGASVPATRETREVTLKMWRNGFTVDDGPLREYTDPSARDFLNSIKQGEIPQELLQMTRGSEVSLNMEDYRQEDYELPKVRLQAFSGKGHLLGSPAPNVVSALVEKESSTNSTEAIIAVDDSQPTTNVQIRLTDGTRLMARLNHTHTVRDLRHYIIQNRPQYATSPFALMTTFPNKELTEDNITLKDANLLNAVIVQRML